MPVFNNNLILGRGKLFFGRFPTGTTTFDGAMKYFGNTPAVNLNVTEETLEHFDSDQGLKIKDRVVTLSQDDGVASTATVLTAMRRDAWSHQSSPVPSIPPPSKSGYGRAQPLRRSPPTGF